MHIDPRRAQGFSLIEILVAFVIASSTLGLLYNVQGGASRGVARAEEYAVATELVKRLLAEQKAGASRALSGVHAKRFVWELRQTPVAQAPLDSALPLVQTHVEVRWDTGRRTQRLALSAIHPVPQGSASGGGI